MIGHYGISSSLNYVRFIIVVISVVVIIIIETIFIAPSKGERPKSRVIINVTCMRCETSEFLPFVSVMCLFLSV